jgi:hypothetical protein
MKDVKRDLQTAYFSLLNGNVGAPVHDFVPASPVYPYVALQQWTEVDDSDKSSFGSDVTFGVQIVDRFSGSGGSRLPMYDIANEIKKIIRARPVPFDIFNWNIINSVVDNETSFKELTDTHLYVYLNIRFRHRVEQIFEIFDQTFDETFA